MAPTAPTAPTAPFEVVVPDDNSVFFPSLAEAEQFLAKLSIADLEERFKDDSQELDYLGDIVRAIRTQSNLRDLTNVLEDLDTLERWRHSSAQRAKHLIDRLHVYLKEAIAKPKTCSIKLNHLAALAILLNHATDDDTRAEEPYEEAYIVEHALQEM